MSLADLPKQYDPQDAQRRWYDFWLEQGYFHADPASDRAAVLDRDPAAERHRGVAPGARAEQHAPGHPDPLAADAGLRRPLDARHRPRRASPRRRSSRRGCCEEEKKTRHDLGREALVERIWAWKDEYEKRILSQLRLMGCSCDWERTRFTLDPICARAVRAHVLPPVPGRQDLPRQAAGQLGHPPPHRRRRRRDLLRGRPGPPLDDQVPRRRLGQRRGAARRHDPARDDARRHGRRRPSRRPALQAPDRQDGRRCR